MRGTMPVEVKVVSFNVRHGLGRDGDNRWELRQEVFANAVRHCAADVLCLQECLDFQADFVAARFPEYRWIGVPREADGTGEMTAIYYRRALLSPIATDHFWLSETPNEPGSKSWGAHCTRMASRAQFLHIPSHRYFHCVDTHFDHGSEEARKAAALLLTNRIATVPAEAPLIVCGDFNAFAEVSESWTVLTGAGLRDAWLEAETRHGPDMTYGAFQAPRPEARLERIDWILYRGPVRAIRCETVLYHENDRYPSDHYPVAATLCLWA